jgi:hypothetical protein
MKTNYLFSISVFVILAAGVSSGYLLHNNHKVEKSLEKEDEVLAPPTPEPKVEIGPATITLAPQVIEAPKQKPIARKPAIPKAAIAQAIMKPSESCEMVCDDNWQESQYGTRYKKCECKK